MRYSRTQILSLMLLAGASILAAQSSDFNSFLNKLSPELQTRLPKIQQGSIFGLENSGDDDEQELIVSTTSASNLMASGFKLISTIGHVATVRIPSSRLGELASSQYVSYVQTPQVELPAQISNSRLMNVYDIHRKAIENLPVTGKDVIVAFYDTGIDWKHMDFRCSGDSSKSRILFMWDQTASADESRKSPKGLGYGVEYTKEEIDAEFSGRRQGHILERDVTGHGTAVAGVAVGNTVKEGEHFEGVASEAEIIVIKGGDESFSEARIIDALAYLDEKGASLNKPVVLNLSLGSQYGAHDGSRLYEKAIDAFCAKPGRAVVVSAGNEGDVPIHGEGLLRGLADSVQYSFSVPSYKPQPGPMNDQISFELWYSREDSILFVIESPTGQRFESMTGSAPQYRETNEGVLVLNNSAFGLNPLNKMHTGTLQLFDFNGKQPSIGTWKITVTNLRPAATHNFHIWITASMFGVNRVFFNPSASVTDRFQVASPGNSSEAITVGAVGFRTSWKSVDGTTYQFGSDNGIPCSFSNAGPRIDGVTKPEMLAPGSAIGSSKSSESAVASAAVYTDGSHRVVCGTSFASPQIAGLVALMLQANPEMTIAMVKAALCSNAKTNEAILASGRDKAGYGVVDGIRLLLDMNKSSYLSADYISLKVIRTSNTSLSLRWGKSRSSVVIGYELLKKTANSVEIIDSYKKNSTLSRPIDTAFVYSDCCLAAVGSNSYLIREIDEFGREKIFGAVKIDNQSQAPAFVSEKAELMQNYPNPCNPTTQISFILPSQQHVALRVYDVLGREIRTLVNDEKTGGKHTVNFDGSALASGAYYVALETGGIRQTRKMQVVK
jgi:minor extracellular serine protease Vpr